MSFVQFKIFCGDNFERCKMHRMKIRKVSTNYLSGNLPVRVHATATPVQAVSLHVRTERTIVNEPAKRQCVSPAPREFARNWDTRRLWLSTAFRFSCKTPAEETCILLFRPLCFVPGSEAVFAALVKHIVALLARSRLSSQF